MPGFSVLPCVQIHVIFGRVEKRLKLEVNNFGYVTTLKNPGLGLFLVPNSLTGQGYMACRKYMSNCLYLNYE